MPNDMAEIRTASQNVSRALLASDETLLGFSGVQVYYSTADSVTAVPYAASGRLFVYYEVQAFDVGSYWIPTSTVTDVSWQGAVDLVASGDIASAHLLRPESQVWWIPQGELSDAISVETVFGRVLGAWPERPPQK